MKICKNCNSVYEDDILFCTKCGSETSVYDATVIEPSCTQDPPADTYTPANTYPQENTYAPVNAYPPVNAEPAAPQTSAKVMGYIGMGTGIFGFVFSLIFFICSFASFAAPGVGVLMFTYSLIFMGADIAGIALTSKAARYGVKSGAVTTGKVLSIIGLVLSIIAIFISFVGMVSMAGSGYYYY